MAITPAHLKVGATILGGVMGKNKAKKNRRAMQDMASQNQEIIDQYDKMFDELAYSNPYAN